jgi:NAD(P)-dependent dehydrogenase (short-subunit alcohol dehydrogenase family)
VSRIFITGSAQGIGAECARQLIAQGHEVVVHGRTTERAEDALRANPDAADAVAGSLAGIAETIALAGAINALGPFDAVIHNAGIGGGSGDRRESADGLELIFHTNVVGPYILSALMPVPERMVYLTSGLEANGRWTPEDLQWTTRPWRGMRAYSDSKLHDEMLSFEMAARNPDAFINAVDPGWIKTNMGGPDAPDPVADGAETQVWLATSTDAAALGTGRYIKRREVQTPNPVALDANARAELVALLEQLTGVPLPCA